MRKILLLAQGEGFYGCAIVVTRTTISEVEESLIHLGYTIEGDGWATLSLFVYGKSVEGQNIMYKTLKPQDAIECPVPTVLFDTGRGKEDLKALNDLIEVVRSF